MFDLNQILSAALNAAVAEAIKPLVERIDRLEFAVADRHQRLLVLEGALTDRVVALESICATQHEGMVAMRDRITALEEKVHFLESQAIVTSNAVDTRISRLENNPAQGVDTQAAPATTTDITKQIITALSDTEHPLFQRLSQFMDAVAEQAIDNHCETYDHDSYDTVASNWNDEDPADFLREGDLHDQIDDRVNETLRNATFSISI